MITKLCSYEGGKKHMEEEEEEEEERVCFTIARSCFRAQQNGFRVKMANKSSF